MELERRQHLVAWHATCRDQSGNHRRFQHRQRFQGVRQPGFQYPLAHRLGRQRTGEHRLDHKRRHHDDRRGQHACRRRRSTTNLASLWHAEGNTFDAFDGNLATLTNGATYAAGRVGQAFSLDGANDYVNVGDPASGNLDFGTGALSLEFWVKPNAYGGTLLNKGANAGLTAGNRSGYYLFLNPTGTIVAEVSSWDTNSSFTQLTTTGTIPLGQWTHVAFVRSATTVQFYFNGVAQTGTTGGNAAPAGVTNVSTSASFRIGARDTTAIGTLGAFLNGSIDQIAAYNRALAQPEIAAAMTGGTFTQVFGTITVAGNLVAANATISGSTATLAAGQFTGPVQVSTTGTLAGVGTVGGNLTNSGIVAPGNSPGIIVVNGNYVQNSSASLNIEIQGTSPVTPDFDQLIVSGTVTLAGALNVSLIGGFVPDPGDSFKIIDNDGVDPITPFPSLPDGSEFNVSGTTFIVTYHGGDGNDLALIVPSEAEIIQDGAGNLLIFGVSAADAFTLRSDERQ